MNRFTIRDLLWLTVVVALVVGWGLDRGKLLSRLNRPGKMDVHVGELARGLNAGETLEVQYSADGSYSVSVKPNPKTSSSQPASSLPAASP